MTPAEAKPLCAGAVFTFGRVGENVGALLDAGLSVFRFTNFCVDCLAGREIFRASKRCPHRGGVFVDAGLRRLDVAGLVESLFAVGFRVEPAGFVNGVRSALIASASECLVLRASRLACLAAFLRSFTFRFAARTASFARRAFSFASASLCSTRWPLGFAETGSLLLLFVFIAVILLLRVFRGIPQPDN